MNRWLSASAPPETQSRVVWVSRHARTVANEAGLLQGWQDFPVSEEGRLEAELAAAWWKHREVTWVVTSPVLRAVETGVIIFGRVDDIDSGWGEQATPALAGRSSVEAHQTYPALIRPDGWSREDAPRHAAVEHIQTVRERAIDALRRLLWAPGTGDVAVVTHGAVLVSLLRVAGHSATTVGNLAVGEFRIDLEGWEVLSVREPLAES